MTAAVETTYLRGTLERLERARANPSNAPALAAYIDGMLAKVRAQLEASVPAPARNRTAREKPGAPAPGELLERAHLEAAPAPLRNPEGSTVNTEQLSQQLGAIDARLRALEGSQLVDATARGTLADEIEALRNLVCDQAGQLATLSARLDPLEERYAVPKQPRTSTAEAKRRWHARELERARLAQAFHERELLTLKGHGPRAP